MCNTIEYNCTTLFNDFSTQRSSSVLDPSFAQKRFQGQVYVLKMSFQHFCFSIILGGTDTHYIHHRVFPFLIPTANFHPFHY